jgi:hypothetical protein
MIGHTAVEPEPVEPPVRRIEVDVLAEVLLGTGADEATDDQHADQQFEADRRRPIEL